MDGRKISKETWRGEQGSYFLINTSQSFPLSKDLSFKNKKLFLSHFSLFSLIFSLFFQFSHIYRPLKINTKEIKAIRSFFLNFQIFLSRLLSLLLNSLKSTNPKSAQNPCKSHSLPRTIDSERRVIQSKQVQCSVHFIPL